MFSSGSAVRSNSGCILLGSGPGQVGRGGSIIVTAGGGTGSGVAHYSNLVAVMGKVVDVSQRELAKAPCLAAVMSVSSRGQHQADLVQADASSFHQASREVATQEASH